MQNRQQKFKHYEKAGHADISNLVDHTEEDSWESQNEAIKTWKKKMFYIKYREKNNIKIRKISFRADEMFTLDFTICDNICTFYTMQ